MFPFAIVALAQHFNIAGVDENSVSAVVAALVTVVTFVMMVVGQLRRRNLKFGLARKSPRF